MRIIILPKYQIFRPFISQLPGIFDTSGKILYQGRNTIKSFIYNNREWIVKRYKKPNPIQQIIYTFFKKSKAERAYLYAQILQSKGISTPEGIAYIEQKKNGLVHEYFFISTPCNIPAIYPTLGGSEEFDTYLADCLAAFFVQMHTKGFLHGDPNLNNILYHEDKEGNVSFSVIDTNRSVFKSSPTQQECLDNLKRITHQRKLLQYITTQYAILRKWDTGQSVETVMKALDKFEKRRKVKHAIKKMCHFKHSSTAK